LRVIIAAVRRITQLRGRFTLLSKGVPIETAVQLANAVSADAWMNIPVMADDNYINQIATLVHHQLLRPDLIRTHRPGIDEGETGRVVAH
jgi:hypothetical protein